MSFYEQLILTATDKLMIGLIVLFVGLWINKKLERFRVELSRLSKEHEIRFSQLHAKREEIISDLYRLLDEARTHLGALGLAFERQSDNEELLNGLARDASEACDKAFEIFKKNRLYLNKELADSIHLVLSTVRVTSQSYPYSEIRPRALEYWDKQSQDISSVMYKLETEFRMMLGSERITN